MFFNAHEKRFLNDNFNECKNCFELKWHNKVLSFALRHRNFINERQCKFVLQRRQQFNIQWRNFFVIESSKRCIYRVWFIKSMKNFEIVNSQNQCSTSLTLIKRLLLHEFSKIIVIELNFNSMKTAFQIMSSNFKKLHYN